MINIGVIMLKKYFVYYVYVKFIFFVHNNKFLSIKGI